MDCYSFTINMLVFQLIMFIYGVSGGALHTYVPTTDNMGFHLQIYNDLKYQRYMETERATCELSTTKSEEFLHTVKKDFCGLMTGMKKHMELMLMCVDALGAKGCIEDHTTFSDNVMETEIKRFTRCLKPALHEQSQLNNTFPSLYDSYHKGYSTALRKIYICQSTYPNIQDSKKRTACIRTAYNKYSRETAPIAQDQFESPCMQNFVTNVIGCLTKSAVNIQVKIEEYRSSVTKCVNLDPESNECVETNGLGFALEPSLASQIEEAQDKFTKLNEKFENTIKEAYTTITEVSLKMKTPTDEFSHDNVKKLVAPYFTTVRKTLAENKLDNECGNLTENWLKDVTERGIKGYGRCYRDFADKTRDELHYIRYEYMAMSRQLQTLGNIAILDCIDFGYVFGSNAIKDCFDLKIRELEVTNLDLFDVLVERTQKIKSRDLPFFDNPYTLPCVVQKFKKIQLDADKLLFFYKRCLYVNTGTEYSVTTPATHTSPNAQTYSSSEHPLMVTL
uniref:Uncharacterized protein n=1 Tax=Graphocephala atropunctata TaxID=36148 RepID=A0A1B6M0I0_9HEMI